MTNSGTAVVVVPAIPSGVIQPLAVQINTNTTYTIPNIAGNYCCYIPATYLVSSSSSSCVLSISTGTGSQVKIPIASNSNSPTGLSSLYLPFYVDTSGNCVASGTETSSGSNSNGSWIQYADGTMECWGWGYVAGGGNQITFSPIFPVDFATAPIISVSCAGQKATVPTSQYDTPLGSDYNSVVYDNVGATPLHSFRIIFNRGAPATLNGNYYIGTWQATGKWR